MDKINKFINDLIEVEDLIEDRGILLELTERRLGVIEGEMDDFDCERDSLIAELDNNGISYKEYEEIKKKKKTDVW